MMMKNDILLYNLCAELNVLPLKKKIYPKVTAIKSKKTLLTTTSFTWNKHEIREQNFF